MIIDSFLSFDALIGMKLRRFALSLLIVSIGLGLILFFLHQEKTYVESRNLSIAYFLFLLVFSVGIYFLSIVAARNPDKNALSRLMILSLMIKLFGSIVIAIAYFERSPTGDKMFVVPFFLIYLVFTIFEVYWFTTVSKQS